MKSLYEFPDKSVSQFVERMAQQFGMTVVDHKGNLEAKAGDTKWLWTLQVPGSPVHMNIMFLYPSYIFVVSFSNEDKSFNFNQFLTRFPGDLHRYNRVAEEKSWSKNWEIQMTILQDHLERELGDVVRGTTWYDFEFHLEDYLSSEAIERMHNDALDRIQKNDAEKDRGSWVHVLNFLKGKRK
ncbi:hypothetical protein [Bdellovibrio bacteriovorus]|uniref:hypothetical protein n=1 Tax=Bdellovibrio bacteriovorus TaxID=959 RepID=UPI0035A6CD16